MIDGVLNNEKPKKEKEGKEKVRVSIKEKLPEMKEKSEKLFGKTQLKQQDLQHKNKTHHEEL